MEGLLRISNRLGIKIDVIQVLYDEMIFPESFQYVANVENQDIFWSRVDQLPAAISLCIHRLDAITDVHSRDFPEESLSNCFEAFYLSNLNRSKIEPTGVYGAGFSHFNEGMIKDVMKQLKGWEINEKEGTYTFDGKVFDDNVLLCMFESYIMNLKPWLFCPMEDIRRVYIELDKVTETIDIKYDTEEILKKLRKFEYYTDGQFLKDVGGLLNKKKIVDKFDLSQKQCNGLSNLLEKAYNVFIESNDNEITQENNEWVDSRTCNLLEQMKLPFGERNALIMTPQLYKERIGKPCEDNFPECSLSELLFSSINGTTMPLPYTNVSAYISVPSKTKYYHSVIKRLISMELLKGNYTKTTETSLNILTDVIIDYIKSIGTNAKTIGNRSNLDQKTINKAISLKNDDFQSNVMNNQYLFNWK